MRWRTRIVTAVVTLAMLALALAGCGSSSNSPSAADPAQVAPGGSIIYVEMTVRPQGSQRSDAQAALSRLIGHNVTPDLQRLSQRLFHGAGLNYQHDVQPWLGQRVGLVVTALSNAGLAVIAPTNNTSAALSALEKSERNDHLSPRSYRGVNYQVGTTPQGRAVAIGIVGHNAIIGGPAAFTQIVDASHGGSLASSQTFTNTLSSLASGSLLRGYISGRQLLSALAPLLSALPTVSPAQRAQLGAVLGRVPGTIALGLAMTPKQITFQVHLNGGRPSSGAGADVSGMPGQAWLALATGSFSPSTQALLSMSQPGPTAAALNLFRQRFGIDLIHDVIPALGPLQLSIQGAAPASVGAGLVVTPSNLAAAGRVLGAIYSRATQSPSVAVSGKPTSFVITKPGLPIPRVAVSEVGRRVLATFDEAFSQITSPATKLSDNSGFQRAKSALGGDNRVPFFVDLATLSNLTAQITSFQTGSNTRVQAILQRLDYFVIGDSPGARDIRAVLGLR